jgi:predicted amidophosphoribosyltransferase
MRLPQMRWRNRLVSAPKSGSAITGSPDESPNNVTRMALAAWPLRERGCPQAHHITRHAAQLVRADRMPRACRNVHDAAPHAAVHWKECARHVCDTFGCAEDFAGKPVAVVDPVMATGARRNEFTRNLRRAGVAAFTGLVVTRPPAHTFKKRTSDRADPNHV